MIRLIEDAIERFTVNSHDERDDAAHAHVGDLGFCDRQTWARRNGRPFADFDTDTLRKFYLGFRVEDFMVQALGGSIDVLLGVRLAMWPGPGGVDSKTVGEQYVPTIFEMIGHPDGVTHDAIAEIKSTEFMQQRTPPYGRILPTIASIERSQPHYLLQAAAYALALHKPWAVLIIMCRASGKYVVLRFDPRDYEKTVLQRMVAVLADTAPDALEPPPRPLAKWQCKYCRYYECEENPHAKQRDRINAV